jgi:hypothetical protein
VETPALPMRQDRLHENLPRHGSRDRVPGHTYDGRLLAFCAFFIEHTDDDRMSRADSYAVHQQAAQALDHTRRKVF